jgi:DNA-binding MarR family transcriptional regulator
MIKSETDIGMLLKNINDSLEKRANAYFHTLGLTIAQVRVLDYIYLQPDHKTTQKKLEVYMDVAHSTINGIVKRLEEKQLLITELTVDTRLTKTVSLTSRGIELYKTTVKSRYKHEKILTGNLTDQERVMLVDLLVKVQQNIK